MKNLSLYILSLTAMILGAALWLGSPGERVDYSTQVKPILNKQCITCHGGVKKNGGFSFLFRDEALGNTESGKPAIIPGHADESEMIRRLLSDDPEVRMPYEKEPLSEEEIDILKRWIDEGAEWGEHWAYQPVEKPQLPDIQVMAGLASMDENTPNEIDLFVRDKLKEMGLKPSLPAPKEILLRRLSLDLIGLPPSEELKESYLFSQNPISYEQVVDELLADPGFGEKWASMWLDLARYADTKGYERDPGRQIWRYRDWLIKALNEDKPYDVFLTEQLAGDLLPNPTDEQLIATAFHRNTMTNDEGGTDNEEFRTEAVLDRVNTTWESLMGTTFACVQCHSHPYDPIRHEDYYRFLAFFNNTRDEDTFAEYPLLRHFQPGDSAKLEKLKGWLRTNTSEEKTKEVVQFVKTWQPSINSIRAGDFVDAELADTKWLVFRNHGVCRLPAVELNDKDFLIYRYNTGLEKGKWTIRLDDPRDGQIVKTSVLPKSKNGWQIDSLVLPKQAGIHDIYMSYENPTLKDPSANGVMFDWFYFTEKFPEGPEQKKYASTFWELVKVKTATTPIMLENPAVMTRTTHVFERGSWLSKADEVQPGVPEIFPPMPDGAPANRLGLAQWMTSPNHPLTSRTIVNRMWEQVFGQGLAETLEDLGSQGIEPTHPELLDYLAWQLVNEYEWSLKTLLKKMVMSATYQQKSVASGEALEKDPFNRYYARASRLRLSAEQIRDQALAVSGLLSGKRYGPSVMPYQPEGIWSSPYGSEKWTISQGEDRYRRGLYTYLKRTGTYPSIVTFDGSSREVCLARRIRTNTPLQALVTLNDSVYVEAAHHLALHMEKSNPSPAQQIDYGYQLAMSRPITFEKHEALEALYQEALEVYGAENEGKKRSLQLVATAILNLDEFLTKN